MIDRQAELPIKRQAQLLGISRGTVYYQPEPVSEADLALMRRIDELHLEHPFAGSRMLRDLLRLQGIAVGRRHVSTLMRRMGIQALYRKPNTSKKHPAHPVFPYVLRGLAIERANHFRRSLLSPVINATGVLLHTNLGRAPVEFHHPPSAINVEFDLSSGERGSRQQAVGGLLATLCAAEAAMSTRRIRLLVGR